MDTPLITIARAFWSSLLLMLNFKETFSLSFLLRVIIQARAGADNLQLKASEKSKLSFTQLLFFTSLKGEKLAFPFHFYPQFLLMHRFPPDKALPVVENVEKRAFMHKELWKSRNLPHFYVVSYL
ncbi:hypothetical protein [Ellagibacter isourolithinifaciens]|uniref:hypothetical protein n=1 Tax=Ellagibacter isourolithinifaciens TaxID=2137581 RepID=UPI003FD81EE7